MRKENEYINGGKKIEGREGPPLKKAGWDVPMDEQRAHPMLKEPSTPDKADQPIAMKWADGAPKKEEKKEAASKK